MALEMKWPEAQRNYDPAEIDWDQLWADEDAGRTEINSAQLGADLSAYIQYRIGLRAIGQDMIPGGIIETHWR